jgi:general stress protein 13
MKKGDIIKGEITAIKPYGAFVKIDDKTSGLIHISEFSDRYVRDIEDYVSIGDVLDLKVLMIEEDNKLSLSFKSLHKRKKRYRIKLKHGFKPLKKQLNEWVKAYNEKNSE